MFVEVVKKGESDVVCVFVVNVLFDCVYGKLLQVVEVVGLQGGFIFILDVVKLRGVIDEEFDIFEKFFG